MGARKLPPERVFGQPRVGHRLRAAPSATWRRISTSAAVSNTPTTWLIASSCRSASSLRRYSSITFSACTRTFLSGAYSEDEAPNARNGVDKRTVPRLDAARPFIWTSVLCEAVGAVVDFAALQVAVEPRAVHHRELAGEAAPEGRHITIDQFR